MVHSKEKNLLLNLIVNFYITIQLCAKELKCLEANRNSIPQSIMQCSRSHSKVVREYFARELLPIYHKYSLPVPEKCPFSPLHDIYHYQENNKTKLDTNKWKCEMCGKFFINENFLDKHYEKRHNNSLQLNKHSICLANHCRIFRCEILMNTNSGSKKCYESTMINLKNRCKNNLESCIPSGIPLHVRNKLTADLRESLCSYLTCSKYNKLPNYMSKGPSFWKIFLIVMFFVLSIIAYGVINHTDLIFDENESNQPLTDTSDGYQFNNGQNINSKQTEKTSSNQLLNNNKNQNQGNFLRHRVNNYTPKMPT